MGGFFGTIKKSSCVTDLFYGVDYNSHMGTKRAGMATFDNGNSQHLQLLFPYKIRIGATHLFGKFGDRRHQ